MASGSLVSLTEEQNHFKALMSDFVFLTVLLDFCAEIKSSSSCLSLFTLTSRSPTLLPSKLLISLVSAAVADSPPLAISLKMSSSRLKQGLRLAQG